MLEYKIAYSTIWPPKRRLANGHYTRVCVCVFIQKGLAYVVYRNHVDRTEPAIILERAFLFGKTFPVNEKATRLK